MSAISAMGAIVADWIALNVAFAAALLTRQDRPEVREKLSAWVLKGTSLNDR
jgi:hypothetical protein